MSDYWRPALNGCDAAHAAETDAACRPAVSEYLSSVRQRIAVAGLMLAWLCANGALWDAMQVAAWGKMLAGYSETMPLPEALRQTFDASKPCEMCRGIAQARTAAEDQTPATELRAEAKFILAFHFVNAPVFANDPDDWMTAPTSGLRERSDPVPVPPPRV